MIVSATRHRLFSYLMAGFVLFVIGRPGHPVSVPGRF